MVFINGPNDGTDILWEKQKFIPTDVFSSSRFILLSSLFSSSIAFPLLRTQGDDAVNEEKAGKSDKLWSLMQSYLAAGTSTNIGTFCFYFRKKKI